MSSSLTYRIFAIVSRTGSSMIFLSGTPLLDPP